MANFLSLAAAFIGIGQTIQRPADARLSPVNFYDFRVYDTAGNAIDMEDYRGRKLLIVNVASKCGFTKQYADLQKLHELHGDKVQVLAFPANNFRKQEPGTNKEIGEFCKENFGVTFPIMEKISVNGAGQNPLYRWLTRKDFNGWNDQVPEWNFCKYLVNEEGQLTHYFNMGVKPMSKEILKAIGAV